MTGNFLYVPKRFQTNSALRCDNVRETERILSCMQTAGVFIYEKQIKRTKFYTCDPYVAQWAPGRR